MTVKNIKARNARTKTPLAYLGPENNPLPVPMFATAYQKDGVTIFAVPGGNHFEVYPDTRVLVDYDPANVKGIKALRWCYQHEGQEPHLRLTGANSKGSGWCGISKSDRQIRRVAGGFKSVHEMEQAEKRAALEATVARAHERMVKPMTREELFAITLRNVARDLGTQSDRFAVLAKQYGYTMEDAQVIAARELDKKGMVDASSVAAVA